MTLSQVSGFVPNEIDCGKLVKQTSTINSRVIFVGEGVGSETAQERTLPHPCYSVSIVILRVHGRVRVPSSP